MHGNQDTKLYMQFPKYLGSTTSLLYPQNGGADMGQGQSGVFQDRQWGQCGMTELVVGGMSGYK